MNEQQLKEALTRMFEPLMESYIASGNYDRDYFLSSDLDARAELGAEMLSDSRMKRAKEIKAAGGPKDNMEAALLSMLGDDDSNSQGEVLDGYADNIRNYEYTYKPEAQEIDPNINPEEVHIGPMAQDIEKVNPACIKEVNGGVKTVDTARLALMNAGAIADLAREIKSLKEALNGRQ